MTIVQNTVYSRDGDRLVPDSLEETFELVRAREGLAWIGLYRPRGPELARVAAEFELHALAIEDAVAAHQRPKVERYGDVLFIVLRPVEFRADGRAATEGAIEVGELHVFVGEHFVVTVRHADSPDLSAVRRELEGQPERLGRGPASVLHAILDEVVDRYQPVTLDLDTRLDRIESAMFALDVDVVRQLQVAFRDLGALEQAVRPVPTVVDDLVEDLSDHGALDEELRRRFRDVGDHARRVVDRLDSQRAILQNTLLANATLVAQQQSQEVKQLTEATFQQSEQVKRISSWAAILFTPTVVPTVYGMNFEQMPELDWRLGYPFALLLMAATCLAMFMVFRRRGWV